MQTNETKLKTHMSTYNFSHLILNKDDKKIDGERKKTSSIIGTDKTG